MMEVILLERVEKLGQMGDVVSVKPGFARNFLLPQKKAMRATKSNLAVFEGQKAQLEAANLKAKDEAVAVGEKLDGLKVACVRQAGDMGQLYGSVNTRDIADAATEAGFTLNRQQVKLTSPIKTLGLHPVAVRLHPEVVVEVVVNVARSEEEAAIQAETGQALIASNDDFADEEEVIEAAAEEEVSEEEAALEEAPAEAEAEGEEEAKAE